MTSRRAAGIVTAVDKRPATQADLDGVTAVLTAAFASDPLWSWAFPDPADLAEWWRLLAGSALRYERVWTLEDHAAVAVWIPPGGVELTEEEEEELVGPLLERLVGSRSAEVQELLERFQATHPHEPVHYYLSLLATHPDHRGKGLGMGLLAECVAEIDAAGAPAYLESSNPANDHRYERLGFVKKGEFNRPDDQLTVSTMWRDPQD